MKNCTDCKLWWKLPELFSTSLGVARVSFSLAYGSRVQGMRARPGTSWWSHDESIGATLESRRYRDGQLLIKPSINEHARARATCTTTLTIKCQPRSKIVIGACRALNFGSSTTARRRRADRYPSGNGAREQRVLWDLDCAARERERESAAANSPCRGCGPTRVWEPRARRPACNPLDGWSATERDQPACTPFQSLNVCLSRACAFPRSHGAQLTTCLPRWGRSDGRLDKKRKFKLNRSFD